MLRRPLANPAIRTQINWLPGWVVCFSLMTLFGMFLCFSDVQGQQPIQEQKLLRHIVLFQFKEASSTEDVQLVVDAFRALPSKIPQIADFEFGMDNSPENLSGGLTHAFLVTFKSEEDRAIYLPHPEHLAFVEVLKPHLEKVTVIDYWAAK